MHMHHQECVAMLLAGGQGSRLGALTKNIAKPAVAFGGKHRIIDFSLSNCTNRDSLIPISALAQHGIWMIRMAEFPYFRLLLQNPAASGTGGLPMPFTAILNILIVTILYMSSSFQATIYTKWITALCWTITRRQRQT